MVSPSRYSITGPLSRHQPTTSRNVIVRSLLHSRQGTPATQHVVQPPEPPYSTRVRRPPRSKPSTGQQYVRALIHETEGQLPWRAERQKQCLQISPTRKSKRRRDEGTSNSHLLLSPTDRPTYGHHNLVTEKYQDYRRNTRPAPQSVRFPERRPIHTRHPSFSKPEDQWRYATSGGSASYHSASGPFGERSHYEHDANWRQHGRYPPQLNYIPLSADNRYSRMHPPPPDGNRLSFSSESTTSSGESAVSWSPSSPTLRASPPPPPVPFDRPYLHGRDFRYAQPEESQWSRHLDVADIHGWVVGESCENLSIEDKDEYERPSSVGSSSPERDDVGETVVYTNQEVIAREPRFAPLHHRNRDLDGITIVQGQHPCSTRITHDVDCADWVKREQTRRRRRAYAFPMWAEPPPKHIRNQGRGGISYRFRGESTLRSDSRHNQIDHQRKRSPSRSLGLRRSPYDGLPAADYATWSRKRNN